MLYQHDPSPDLPIGRIHSLSLIGMLDDYCPHSYYILQVLHQYPRAYYVL